MDFEIEWGYEDGAGDKDYSGRIEVYDGRVSGLGPLNGDDSTVRATPCSWRSPRSTGARRGVAASLLYMGTAKWRQTQPFTSQRDDVARTIVTVWTESGNFSFLAADLENGPILAPEYGFFVRRTSEPPAPAVVPDLRVPRSLLAEKMPSIAGSPALLGWGSDATPWFGGNSADEAVSVQGITIPARSLAMHPGPADNVAVGWRSPIEGNVKVTASVAHGQSGSNGIDWWMARETPTQRTTLASGTTDGHAAVTILIDPAMRDLGNVPVAAGDLISLVVGPKGAHPCDTTIIEFTVAEVGGLGRTWNLAQEVLGSLHRGNPHADSQNLANVWHFYSERTSESSPVLPSRPPIVLASQAASARDFLQELQTRQLSTIRQQIRGHEEQTWDRAVTELRGSQLPPHPVPPQGFEPRMQVHVPCPRLAAQWNLGDLASGAARRKTSADRSSVVQRLSLWHPRCRNVYGSGSTGSAGVASGGRGRVGSVGVVADGSRFHRSSRLGPAGPAQWTLFRGARVPHARSGSAGCRRPHGRRSRVWPRFDRLGTHRTLLADRRPGLAESRRAPDQGQRRVDACVNGGWCRTWSRAVRGCGARDCNRRCR